MRTLFEYDFKNYIEKGTVGRRPSARGIIIKNGKIALIHTLKHDFYKFPGGGIDKNESNIDGLIREVREEAGLVVKPETIKEYGYVLRKEKGKFEDMFIQENFYYLCDCEDEEYPTKLEEDEIEDRFVFEWMDPRVALDTNRNNPHSFESEFKLHMVERETRVLELLINEGYFDK